MIITKHVTADDRTDQVADYLVMNGYEFEEIDGNLVATYDSEAVIAELGIDSMGLLVMNALAHHLRQEVCDEYSTHVRYLPRGRIRLKIELGEYLMRVTCYADKIGQAISVLKRNK